MEHTSMNPTNTVNNHINIGLYDRNVKQLPWIIRACWFLVFGWWTAALWVNLAYLLCLTCIFISLGQSMFTFTPSILTLQKR